MPDTGKTYRSTGAIAVEPFTLRRKWVRAPSFADN